MTADEARERFSEAHEGTLARGEQHAFEQLLQADAALRAEYDAFVEVVYATAKLGDDDEDLNIDLLPGLQDRLRAQSGGRFYRDRFAKRAPQRTLPILAASALVLVFCLMWLAFEAGLF